MSHPLPRLNVYLIPALADPRQMAGGTAVVIDVLRATTTIVHALAAGAKEVIPCLTVEQAKEAAPKVLAANPAGCLLGGERGGVRIEGFDLGNSPREYTAEVVQGRSILFTTTNGTKAMESCRLAKQILIAGFVNLSAVCRDLSEAETIHIVCAGTEGEVTREDVLLAGAIVDLLNIDEAEMNDQAQIAVDAWRTAQHGLTAVPLSERLKASRGGRNVLRIGMEDDIEIAATLDLFDFAPRLDVGTWRITGTKHHPIDAPP